MEHPHAGHNTGKMLTLYKPVPFPNEYFFTIEPTPSQAIVKEIARQIEANNKDTQLVVIEQSGEKPLLVITPLLRKFVNLMPKAKVQEMEVSFKAVGSCVFCMDQDHIHPECPWVQVFEKKRPTIPYRNALAQALSSSLAA